MQKTKVTKDLLKRCDELGMNGDEVLQKSKMLLSCYRSICFSAKCRALDLRAEAKFANTDLTSALIYLSEFAPDSERERFESKVSSLFKTERLVSLVDLAMESMNLYFTRSRMYYELISKAYLTKRVYRSEEIADILGVDLKVFYLRRQEGLLLFGYMLWGHVIPIIQKQGWPTSQINRITAPTNRSMAQNKVDAAS